MNKALCIKDIKGLKSGTWYNFQIFTLGTQTPQYTYIGVIDHLHPLTNRMTVTVMIEEEEFNECLIELHEVRDDIINDLFT